MLVYRRSMASRWNGRTVVVTHVSYFSRQTSRLRRVCSSRMMLVKKYGEAISQERIVGNCGLKEFFPHITRQVWPKFKRCVAQQQLKLPGQIIHMLPPMIGQICLLSIFYCRSDPSSIGTIPISQLSNLTYVNPPNTSPVYSERSLFP